MEEEEEEEEEEEQPTTTTDNNNHQQQHQGEEEEEEDCPDSDDDITMAELDVEADDAATAEEPQEVPLFGAAGDTGSVGSQPLGEMMDESEDEDESEYVHAGEPEKAGMESWSPEAAEPEGASELLGRIDQAGGEDEDFEEDYGEEEEEEEALLPVEESQAICAFDAQESGHRPSAVADNSASMVRRPARAAFGSWKTDPSLEIRRYVRKGDVVRITDRFTGHAGELAEVKCEIPPSNLECILKNSGAAILLTKAQVSLGSSQLHDKVEMAPKELALLRRIQYSQADTIAASKVRRAPGAQLEQSGPDEAGADVVHSAAPRVPAPKPPRRAPQGPKALRLGSGLRMPERTSFDLIGDLLRKKQVESSEESGPPLQAAARLPPQVPSPKGRAAAGAGEGRPKAPQAVGGRMIMANEHFELLRLLSQCIFKDDHGHEANFELLRLLGSRQPSLVLPDAALTTNKRMMPAFQHFELLRLLSQMMQANEHFELLRLLSQMIMPMNLRASRLVSSRQPLFPMMIMANEHFELLRLLSQMIMANEHFEMIMANEHFELLRLLSQMIMAIEHFELLRLLSRMMPANDHFELLRLLSQMIMANEHFELFRLLSQMIMANEHFELLRLLSRMIMANEHFELLRVLDAAGWLGLDWPSACGVCNGHITSSGPPPERLSENRACVRLRIEAPPVPPVDYYWLAETFGPGASTGLQSQRYEATGFKAYMLNYLVELIVTPWTSVRSATGPVTINFRTAQSVGVLGKLVVLTPDQFIFTEVCISSQLQLADPGVRGGAVVAPWAVPTSALRCTVVTPAEVNLHFVAPTDDRWAGGLAADTRYTITIHSVVNPVSGAFSAALQWRLETQDADTNLLDGPAFVASYLLGEQLPYAELLPGGPSTGQDYRAGQLQWVIVAFRVALPSRPGQYLRLLAGFGSSFEASCAVRDPPPYSLPAGAVAVGNQLLNCRGLGHWADLEVGAVWQPRSTLVFQVQVRNAVPGGAASPSLEEPFRRQWRICLGPRNSGCEQMRALEPQRPVLSLHTFGLLATSRVLGDLAPLVVRFSPSTAMPAGGTITLRAPSGFMFPLVCVGLSSEPVEAGYAALPLATHCEGGAVASGAGGRRGRSLSLLPSELQLTLGPQEKDRLMAYKRYAFSVGLQNPGRDNQPLTFSWEFRSATPAGDSLDLLRTDDAVPITGQLLLPMSGFPVVPLSSFAGESHSIRISFRLLSSQEGGDSDIIYSLSRIDVFAPVDRGSAAQAVASVWDFTDPSACIAPFYTQAGQFSQAGLVHGNVTTAGGQLACAVLSAGQLALAFRPYVISASRIVTLEFASRNPSSSPIALWNSWTIRVAKLRSLEEDSIKAPMELEVLVRRLDLFEHLCEAIVPGFDVVPTLISIALQPSNWATNVTCLVDFEIVPRSVVPRGAAISVILPPKFRALPLKERLAVFAGGPYGKDGNLELPETGGASAALSGQESLLVLVAEPPGDVLRFRFGLVNAPEAPEDGSSPMWAFEVLASGDPGAAVLERTSGLAGYHVNPKIEVAGIFGSVRELGSQYNFVRITFRLPPEAVMPSGGTIVVISPPGYKLSADGFARENLPAQSAAVIPDPESTGSGSDPRVLNISTIYPLEIRSFYAFSFSVQNPPATVGGDTSVPWELWIYSIGRVVATNREVPPFGLEARFTSIEVLPSSVVPLQLSNHVEIQVVLGSSALELGLDGLATLELVLPHGFTVVQEVGGGSRSWCRLGVQSLSRPSQVVALKGTMLLPLPASSSCLLRSPVQLAIELREPLELGVTYHFQIQLVNPLQIASVASHNTWKMFTARDGASLHISGEVTNFELTAASGFEVLPSDVRLTFTQELMVSLIPPRHVQGSSTLELKGPESFRLSCNENGTEASLGLLPPDSSCSLLGSTVVLKMPAPVPYAPYQPYLVAGELYYFGVYCANPEAAADGGGAFELRLAEGKKEVLSSPRLLALRGGILAPLLAPPLEFFDVSVQKVAPPGELTAVALRFRAPVEAGRAKSAVRSVLLEGPAGMVLAEGGAGSACFGFRSRAIQIGDMVLPQSRCSGVTARSVLLGLPERLPLESPSGQGLTYSFELDAQSPSVQVLSDSFLLALLPGPAKTPFYAATAPGFVSQVPGLRPALPPPLLPEMLVPKPKDSDLDPLSTVGIQVSSAMLGATASLVWLSFLFCLLLL
ncbi:unnamed protein product [Polarella glacialis]|uniref:Uncharacterized protein n=1 Tax=Polarella glacialis TaxID=89957 RepID=A0A813DM26_POLGL|nr:unnamed protein product [Polarella glacialis]